VSDRGSLSENIVRIEQKLSCLVRRVSHRFKKGEEGWLVFPL
jgi:hypothetical protein